MLQSVTSAAMGLTVTAVADVDQVPDLDVVIQTGPD